MKKYLFTAVAVLASVVMFAQGQSKDGKSKTPAKKDAPRQENTYTLTDFRDIKWGSHLDSVFRDSAKVNFVKSTNIEDKNAYTIAGDDMFIGTVHLKNIYYIFNDEDRFIGVYLVGDSKQFGEMKYILTSKFGQSSKTEESSATKHYYWNIDDVLISLVNNSISKMFNVEFSSNYTTIESKRINGNVDDF